jgi:hypothetical protein
MNWARSQSLGGWDGVAVGVGVEGVVVAVGLAVGVAVTDCVGVGVGVTAVPATLIATHQDFVPPVPRPNRIPLAFWNLQ